MKKVIQTITIFVFLGSLGLWGRTKLTTLPERSKIRIDLKNSNFTLVEEERTINLQKGVNQVEFAWANTYIDKSSIQFRNIKAPGRLSVLNVNYPPNESALFWQVYSQTAGPGDFRISYLISNLNKTISYEAIADRNEKHMLLKTYFKLQNLSGEHFQNADLEINFGTGFKKSLRIGESKKMLAAKFRKVPVVKDYVFDTAVDTKNVRMYYILENISKQSLGKFALPGGKVRIFQEDSVGTEAFIGEDWGAYTPIGQKMRLYLGQAKEVKVKQFMYKNEDEFVNKPVKNYNQIIKFQVENFKKSTVPLKLMLHPGGEWVLEKTVLKEEIGERDKKRETKISNSRLKTKRIDTNNLEVLFNVPHTKEKKYNVYLYITLKNRW